MCYSLCILLGAPSREEPLEVVLDLWRVGALVQDLLARGVHSRTREAPGAQPMRVQSIRSVLLRSEEGHAQLALDAHLGDAELPRGAATTRARRRRSRRCRSRRRTSRGLPGTPKVLSLKIDPRP